MKIFGGIPLVPRVDKQECATPDLSCTICRYPRPRRNFLLTSPFFRETRTLPQSSVRARAGHRPCSVKPGQVHEGNLSKRLAARASSKRLRQQKIPPWANPSASCTLLFIYSCSYSWDSPYLNSCRKFVYLQYPICGQNCFVLCGLVSAAQRK